MWLTPGGRGGDAFIPNLLYDTWGSWAIGQYNDALQNPAKLSGYDLLITSNWVDFYDPNTQRARADLMADDVHPNADGYGIMAENWFEAVCSFPSMRDTDEDGISDAEETACGMDPESADTDGDGVGDYVEYSCAGSAAAQDPNATPAAIRVNLQPPLTASLSGHAPDRGRPFNAPKGLGWIE
ncbi:MAG: hypothetical protein PHN82_01085 [bacterium]|nr:hypothetical protein [bacterium]